jgi:hypothetical protein
LRAIRTYHATHIDIRENKVLGREYNRGLRDGELIILRGQIEERFGPMPVWAEESLMAKTAAELEEISVRVLDVPDLDELLSPIPQ